MELSQAIEFGVSRMLIDKLRTRGISQFTAAQAAALKEGVCLDISLLVVAPTSSGKTLIAELVAVESARKGHRTVYLVSHRALAEEKFRLLSREYAQPGGQWFEVSIATGDHVEGAWNTGILVATYEKYLAMLCSGGYLNPAGIVVIADEIQILCDDHRGPEIELLCTLLRKKRPRQIVALSATVSNPGDLATWLSCSVVQTHTRDVPLQQEVWYRGESIQCLAGTTEVFEGRRKGTLPRNTLDVVEHLLHLRLGPLLVFAMTRRRAIGLAEDFAARRQNTPDGLGYADQLELFSDPSTLVRTLTKVAQKKVAFHTADLSFSERALVEEGLTKKLFDVVFATPTLAAGVNFPFQTVLFDAFHRPWAKDDPWISLAEYQNMAGRAGRLGLHEKGYAIVLPESEVFFDRARTLISAHVEPIHSRFSTCNFTKLSLMLIASKVVRGRDELLEFFRETLWWYQAQDKNPRTLEGIPKRAEKALEYLERSGLVARSAEKLFATRLGVATAATGLLPTTVMELLILLKTNQNAFTSDGEAWISGTLHAACASSEFGEMGQRILPFSRHDQPEPNALYWLRAAKLFRHADTVDEMDKVTNAAYGLWEWVKGTAERSLRNMVPPISYGYMQQLATDVATVLDGLAAVMRVPDADCPPILPNALNTLAERLRFGVPSDVLDLLKAARRYLVPGFGRHRAMALHQAGLSSPNDVLKCDRKRLGQLLENETRAAALTDALVKYFDAPLEILKVVHVAKAKDVNLDPALVQRSYEAVGQDYEVTIEALLAYVREWKVTRTDKGKRQAFPDFMIECGARAIVVECKTKQKNTATLSKEEAFAVLTKATDFKKDHCLTIGKPDFDDMSRSKADGSSEVTLMRHHDLVEGILRYSAGKVSGEQLFAWLMTPGYARLAQLDALAISPGN